jgi:hypothetical protein
MILTQETEMKLLILLTMVTKTMFYVDVSHFILLFVYRYVTAVSDGNGQHA